MTDATQKLLELTVSSDEESIRKFIQSNWNEFPQKIQDSLSVALFSEGLRENTEGNEEFETFKEELLAALENDDSSATNAIK